MFIIALILFIACVALFLYNVLRLRRQPSRRLRFWLAGSGTAVLLLGAASALVYGQLGVIQHQREFLTAAITAQATTKHAIAHYDAAGSSIPVPCTQGVAAARRFYTTYATAATWKGRSVTDHSLPAVLAYIDYRALETKGCVTQHDVDTTLAGLRAMRAADAKQATLTLHFLTRLPIGLMPFSPSLHSSANLYWKHLSPHAIAVQDCFAHLLRTSGTSPTTQQINACNGPHPHVDEQVI